jgi:hypothetical protein
MPARKKAKKGLRAAPQKRSARKPVRKKSADELAGTRIDRFQDKSASTAEKARRKRRLLQGPEEFRTFRSDRTKK